MSDALMWINFVGLIGAWYQTYSRVGFPQVKRESGADWREFLLGNAGWFGLAVVKVLFWWVTLVVWFFQGRPGPTWRAVTELDGREVRRIVRTDTAKGASSRADDPSVN